MLLDPGTHFPNDWQVLPPSNGEASLLSRELGVSPLLAHLLVSRGVSEPALAHAFLKPDAGHLHDPFLLKDMGRAVARLQKAMSSGELISVQGDYDADGTCGAAILTWAFRRMGVKHQTFIPSREGDGYGLSIGAVKRAHEAGARVLITVDNGISCVEEVAFANGLGLDVIVTDHHQFGAELPAALALLHPGLPDSGYPESDLSGTSVAFKLALALLQAGGQNVWRSAEFREFLTDALGLVAIASIADMVPLLGENRTLCKFGLLSLLQSRRPGIRALLDVSKVSGSVTSTDVGFKLAPRLNAAGRMGQEEVALRLLLSENAAEARQLALDLDRLNSERQKVERAISNEAKSQVESQTEIRDNPVLVVSGDGWSQGVLGIVASRLVDAYGKPAIVLRELPDGSAKGSARSTAGFHLYDALSACRDTMTRFGGHRAAAGLSLPIERIGELRRALAQCAGEFVIAEALGSGVVIDAVLDADCLSTGLARDITAMEPFGEGNREPVLALGGMRVVGEPRLIGKTQSHLTMLVVGGGGSAVRTIGFGMGKRFEDVRPRPVLDLAFVPRINPFRGVENLELELRDFRVCGS